MVVKKNKFLEDGRIKSKLKKTGILEIRAIGAHTRIKIQTRDQRKMKLIGEMQDAEIQTGIIYK